MIGEQAGAADASASRQKQRQARRENLLAMQAKTAQLFAGFDQFTRQRWEVVRLLAAHGYAQESAELAQHVQMLQDCCDANALLMAKHASPSSTHSAAADDAPASPDQQQPQDSSPDQQQQGPAAAASQHAHGSSQSSPPQHQPAAAPRPPPPPPPPPSAAPAAAAGAAGSPRPAAPPPPPPGPPPKHTFSTQQQQQPGIRPPPPPPPLPAGGPGRLLGRSMQAGSSAAGSSTSSSTSPSAAEAPPGACRSPPPPPPLPPLGFSSTPTRPRVTPSRFAAAAAATSRGGGQHQGSDDSPSSSSSPPRTGGTLQGINAIAAAAAAAGAKRAQQELMGAGGRAAPEPCTPQGALLPPLHGSFQHSYSPRSAPEHPAAAAGAAGGGVGSSSTCSKLKRLHVDPVPKHRMTDGSFWRTTEDVVQPFQAEVEYALRCMFSNTPAHAGRRGAGADDGHDGCAAADEAAAVIKVIPDKRALQVEVCIKRLRMQAGELAAALNRIDTDKLKQDDLPQIRSMLPKPDELSAIQTAKSRALREYEARLRERSQDSSLTNSGSSSSHSAAAAPLPLPLPPPPRLGVVEATFEALGGVRMLMAKMRACEFRYDVEAVSAQVQDFCSDLSTSLESFRTCGQLQYLLAFVRDVANTMNASAVAGGAAVEGFKLESLSRLQSTRMAGATDLNLLHYIVAHLSNLMPGVLELSAEKEAFKAVTKRGTFDTVLVRVRGLRDMHKRITADLSKAREQQRLSTRHHHSSNTDASGPAVSSPTAAAAAAAAAADGDDNTADDDSEQAVYIQRLTHLLASSGTKLEEMQRQMDAVMQAFSWTAEFFCEDGASAGTGWKQQPVAFITHFHDLLEALEATRKDTARVARVGRILTQFVEERQMMQQQQQEEEEEEEEAAAAQAGVELGWDGDDQDEEQEQEAGHGGGADADAEELRLTRMNSWVIDAARSLQFGPGSPLSGSCCSAQQQHQEQEAEDDEPEGGEGVGHKASVSGSSDGVVEQQQQQDGALGCGAPI